MKKEFIKSGSISFRFFEFILSFFIERSKFILAAYHPERLAQKN